MKIFQPASRKQWIRAAIATGAIVLLTAAAYLVFLLNPAYDLSPETVSLVQGAVAKQQKIEKEILTYYQAGKFTFTSPLVLQDPYGSAPLTALLIFDTPDAAQISIHVPGKTAQAGVDFTFDGYVQHHEIPVYGLYPDTLNQVTVSMKLQNGQSSQTDVALQTEPLPVYLAQIQVESLNPSQYSPGFNFTFVGYKTIFDLNGVVRWYSTASTTQVFSRLNNGRYLYTYYVGDAKNMVVMEEDLLGKIYAIYNVTGGVHHDIYELPNGNFLVTSQDMNSKTYMDFLFEIDRNSGHVVHSFDLKKYLDQNRPTFVNENIDDWLHLNSIVYDPADSSIILSSRTQSAIIKMSYPGMKIQWILGPHDGWSAKFQPYLLTPVGQPFEWSWMQHHATLYSPDAPGDNQIDILLFDDGNYRNFDLSKAYSTSESYSRVVHYRIDEAKMTVEQVWEYGKERGNALFSATRGSAYVLANGNVLGDFADLNKDATGKPATANGQDQGRVIEVNPATNGVASEYSILGDTSYRVLRAGFYEGYSEKNNYLVTEMQDYSAPDLADRAARFSQDAQDWLTQMASSLKVIWNDVLHATGR